MTQLPPNHIGCWSCWRTVHEDDVEDNEEWTYCDDQEAWCCVDCYLAACERCLRL